jgi:hypothetical protein
LKTLHPDDNILVYFKVPKFQYVNCSRGHLISIHCTVSGGYSETRIFWDVMYMLFGTNILEEITSTIFNVNNTTLEAAYFSEKLVPVLNYVAS